MHPRVMLAAIAAVLAIGVSAPAWADSAEEPPADADDCTIDDKCPESGVLCGGEVCLRDEQCPTSGVECYEDQACGQDALAAGLELRCAGREDVYCAADEGPPAGSAQACRNAAIADGLEATCIDVNNDDVFCDPSEEEPGCSVETIRSRPGSGAAAAMFLVAAAVALLRARRSV
jgi:hypothetical protein